MVSAPFVVYIISRYRDNVNRRNKIRTEKNERGGTCAGFIVFFYTCVGWRASAPRRCFCAGTANPVKWKPLFRRNGNRSSAPYNVAMRYAQIRYRRPVYDQVQRDPAIAQYESQSNEHRNKLWCLEKDVSA